MNKTQLEEMKAADLIDDYKINEDGSVSVKVKQALKFVPINLDLNDLVVEDTCT